jgi:KUP system potassium uptake protein
MTTAPLALEPAQPAHPPGRLAWSAVLGALGVVFGDIGTSPLYTFQECVGERGVPAAQPENVLGVCSLIFWALCLVVTIKYLWFLMRADNRGEGGIFALLALVPEREPRVASKLGWVTVLVATGAALLFGDGIITPAISVLSALEGLQVATPALQEAVVPLTCLVLLGLFALQSRGTGGVGKLFGPVMVVWFVSIGVLGLVQIAQNPSVLWALSPSYGARFFATHGWRGFTLLGSVVLAVTGGEALYADMGHFGRGPIRLAWLGLVFPALVLCYLGQGALLLRDPTQWEQPFFALVPHGAGTWALVALAAPATVIASQALISGVFSLAHQGVQLGLFPRVELRHTSSEAEGQIYLPALNWGLAGACIALVLIFRKSSALAAAFGLAVSGTMAITSVVYFEVVRQHWRWPRGRALAVLLFFLSFDLPFLGANLLKFKEGGYLPLLVGSGFLVVMLVWRKGRGLLAEHTAAESPPLAVFMGALARPGAKGPLARVPGTAVFLNSTLDALPPALLRHVQRIHALHEAVVLLTVVTEHAPTVAASARASVRTLGNGFFQVVVRYGFMEQPDVPAALEAALREASVIAPLGEATYYLGRETFLATSRGRMGRWSELLFAFLSRNAHGAASYFRIPAEQVIELGIQIDL